eukprot:10954-Heterococcus_DN1.PRE.2
MHSASEGLKIDNVELHEFAYTFFANLAKVMKIKMAPYLPVLVPHLLAEQHLRRLRSNRSLSVSDLQNLSWQCVQTINESDSEDPQALAQAMAAAINVLSSAFCNVHIDMHTLNSAAVLLLLLHCVYAAAAATNCRADGATDDEADEDYDSDADSEESYDQQYMNVHTAALDKKKAALLVLGALAQFAPTAFESYLQPVLECLKVNAESWHSEIRSEVRLLLMVVVLETFDILHVAGAYRIVDAILQLLAVEAAAEYMRVQAVCTWWHCMCQRCPDCTVVALALLTPYACCYLRCAMH